MNVRIGRLNKMLKDLSDIDVKTFGNQTLESKDSKEDEKKQMICR